MLETNDMPDMAADSSLLGKAHSGLQASVALRGIKACADAACLRETPLEKHVMCRCTVVQWIKTLTQVLFSQLFPTPKPRRNQQRTSVLIIPTGRTRR